MSRIGRLPIPVPAGVEVTLDGRDITVKGPKGTLARDLHPDMRVVREDGTLVVQRPTDAKMHRAAPRPDPDPRGQHGRRRHRPATARASRSPASATAPARSARSSSSTWATATRSRSIRRPGISFEVENPTRLAVVGHRQGARRPDRRQGPRDPQARAVQGQGRPLRGRGRSAARPARPARSAARSSMPKEPRR